MDKTGNNGSPYAHTNKKPDPGSKKSSKKSAEAFAELQRGLHSALENYSNVHRGSGHKSLVSTNLFEKARDIVLEYLGLNKDKYVVIFCTPRRAAIFTAQLNPGSYRILSNQDIGLSIGVRALAVDKKALPRGIPFQTGGGTTRLISRGWVIRARPPDKFEAGTPAIINIIMFARALQLLRHYGNNIFRDESLEVISVNEILYHDELEGYSGELLLNELKKTLIGRNIIVPTTEGRKPFINRPHSAQHTP